MKSRQEKIKKLHSKVENQLASLSLRFNQYDILPKIITLLDKHHEKLSQEERMGLCNGLSAYYLYSKANKRTKYFFNQWTKIAKWDEQSEINNETELEFHKFIRHVRRLHAPSQYTHGYHQQDLHKTTILIQEATDYPIIHEFGISSIYTKDEFIVTLEQCIHAERMFLLNTGGHAMALYLLENGTYCFFDPDFKGGCEIEFDNLNDVYDCLTFASIDYKLEQLENLPEYLPLGFNLFRTNQQNKEVYPDNVKLIEQFIQDDPDYFKRKGPVNRNLLFLSCVSHHPEITARLLQESACQELINEAESWMGHTPLTYCCQEGYIDLVKLLLDHKANPDLPTTKYNITPLQAAIDSENESTVALLIQAGANILQAGTGGNIPLFRALKSGRNPTIFKMLWSAYLTHPATNGMNITQGKENLLNVAVRENQYEIVKFLLDQASVSNIQMPSQKIINEAFRKAVVCGHIKIADFLLSTHKAVCDGITFMRCLAQDKYHSIEFFKLLEKAIINGGCLMDFDTFNHCSLAAWALEKSQKNPIQPFIATGCVELIIKQLNQNPIDKFHAEVTLQIKELWFSLKNKKDNSLSGQNLFPAAHPNMQFSIEEKQDGIIALLEYMLENPGQPIAHPISDYSMEHPQFLTGVCSEQIQEIITWIEEKQKQLRKSYA